MDKLRLRTSTEKLKLANELRSTLRSQTKYNLTARMRGLHHLRFDLCGRFDSHPVGLRQVRYIIIEYFLLLTKKLPVGAHFQEKHQLQSLAPLHLRCFPPTVT